MDTAFTHDLDEVLQYLYEMQYADPHMGEGHNDCVKQEDIRPILTSLPNRKKPAPRNQERFVEEQLTSDDLVRAHPADGGRHLRITNKGRLFKEAGGYARLEKDKRIERSKNRIIQLARGAETVTLLSLAGFTAWMQFDDHEKDERIVQHEMRIIQLETELGALAAEKSSAESLVADSLSGRSIDSLRHDSVITAPNPQAESSSKK